MVMLPMIMKVMGLSELVMFPLQWLKLQPVLADAVN